MKCQATVDSCSCSLDQDHEEPHTCQPCGGQWDTIAGEFVVFRYPFRDVESGQVIFGDLGFLG